MSIRQCIFITGMSGAGKSTVLKILEDRGFCAVDNIPPTVIPQLLAVLSNHTAAMRKGVALTVDIRSEILFGDFVQIFQHVKKEGVPSALLFVYASDEVLRSRFELTRRRHPLEESHSMMESIEQERQMLDSIRARADISLDTSFLDAKQCKAMLSEYFTGDAESVSLVISSFGFKYGVPMDCHYAFDVRLVPNPYYIPELRSLTGKDKAVQDYVASFPTAREFLRTCIAFLDFVVPNYFNTGKLQMHVAIGCTGGKHRSVAFAEWLYRHFTGVRQGIRLNHRDISKGYEI
jgi:UPF0042 nucleotide-binding protein